ncbi:MAG TPA: hypothetical protein VJ485_03200 [archaeon]|nr:hypothetical protein [archaeon]
MDGKAVAGRAIILHYVDEDPFSLKRNLVIYTITPESVDYMEFFISGEFKHGSMGMQMLDCTPLKKLPTDGRSHRAKDIEYTLRKECARKGKNIIKTEDMSEETASEMAISHMSEYLKIRLKAECLKFQK